MEVFVLYNEWRQLRDMRRHSHQSLCALENKRIKTQRKILSVFPIRNAKEGGWNFPKFWNMRQYEQWIPYVGNASLTDTGSDERTNKNIKSGSQALNNRVNQTNNILMRELMVKEELEAVKAATGASRGGFGITQRAANTMECALTKRPHLVKYEELLHSDPLLLSKEVRALLASQPELKHFARKLVNFLMEGESAGHTAGRIVYLHNAVAMPPAEDDSEGTYIIRAASKFHGEPRFDTVKVRMATSLEPDLPDEYMQVRTIFSYYSAEDAGLREPRVHIAIFGRWYQRMGVSTHLQSMRLKWESHTVGRLTLSYRYDCISLESIRLERVVIIPNFEDSPGTHEDVNTFYVYRNWG